MIKKVRDLFKGKGNAEKVERALDKVRNFIVTTVKEAVAEAVEGAVLKAASEAGKRCLAETHGLLDAVNSDIMKINKRERAGTLYTSFIDDRIKVLARLFLDGVDEKERQLVDSLSLSIAAIGLSNYSRGALNRAGVERVFELVELKDKGVLGLCGVGRITLSDAKARLETLPGPPVFIGMEFPQIVEDILDLRFGPTVSRHQALAKKNAERLVGLRT